MDVNFLSNSDKTEVLLTGPVKFVSEVIGTGLL